MSQAPYNIFPVLVPASETHVQDYKTIRLLSLKTDPDQFSSTFERESAFTDVQWRARLDSLEKVLIVASKTHISSESHVDEEWVGVLTVLGPSFVRTAESINKMTPAGVTPYGLGGMWVHPEYRRLGLGKRMIDAGFEWARGDGGVHRKLLFLEVYRQNEAAKSLYAATGFEEVAEDGPQDGSDSVWMVRSL